MKVAIISESPADQAALAVWVGALIGSPLDPINMNLEARTIPGIFSALAGDFRALHYNSDAEALVVVVDCDRSPLHEADHISTAEQDECRFCKIREIIARARRPLKPRVGMPELKIAVGLAVPEIEAWYLVGKNHEVGESRWKQGLVAQKPPFTKSALKNEVYGTDRPSLLLETERAVQEARRLAADLPRIEAAFPVGFGMMATEIRAWAVKRN